MKSIRINNPDTNSSMLGDRGRERERESPKSANHRGASKNQSLSTASLTISVFQLWQLILLSLLLSFFFLSLFSRLIPLHPSAPGGPQREGEYPPLIHSGPLSGGSQGPYTWEGQAQWRVDLHLFKQPYLGYWKGEGGG